MWLSCYINVYIARQNNVHPPVRTIEGVLFESLVKAGAVSQDNADDPLKVFTCRQLVVFFGGLKTFRLIWDAQLGQMLVSMPQEMLFPSK